MNRTKAAGQARTFIVVSVLFFVLAVISTSIPNVGIYVSLALVVFGGFAMLISAMIREKARPVVAGIQEDEEILA